jgi:Predicted phosphoadenosine phosphosulfate sulfotransferase
VIVYLNENVYEAARKRISYVFDNFENVVVAVSGGKDSTVVFNLCMEEAEKRGRLPLGVMWIDQEAEWRGTVEHVKSIMYDERVKPYWLQVPILLMNATSHDADNWLHCWRDGEEWMRDKDPISIKENVYGTEHFYDLFSGFMRVTFPEGGACLVAGMRAEENPVRRLTLTETASYKHITWAKCLGGGNYTFYPIYDWSLSDVWHAISSNKWKYNSIYDAQYRYGIPMRDMRVSNLNHETAVKNLYYVREAEPETWDALTARMNGIDTTMKIAYEDNFMAPKELPFMFKSWREYRDFLLENLVSDDETRKKFESQFERLDKKLVGSQQLMDEGMRAEVASILANDHWGTKLKHFEQGESVSTYWKIRKKRKISPKMEKAAERVIKEMNSR